MTNSNRGRFGALDTDELLAIQDVSTRARALEARCQDLKKENQEPSPQLVQGFIDAATEEVIASGKGTLFAELCQNSKGYDVNLDAIRSGVIGHYKNLGRNQNTGPGSSWAEDIRSGSNGVRTK